MATTKTTKSITTNSGRSTASGGGSVRLKATGKGGSRAAKPAVDIRLSNRDVIHEISERQKLDPKAVRATFEGLSEVLTEHCAIDGAKVTLQGIGSFSLRTAQSRQINKPGDGDKMGLPAFAQVICKISKTLQDRAKAAHSQAE